MFIILILKCVHNVHDNFKLKIFNVKTEYRLHVFQRKGGRELVVGKEKVWGEKEKLSCCLTKFTWGLGSWNTTSITTKFGNGYL